MSKAPINHNSQNVPSNVTKTANRAKADEYYGKVSVKFRIAKYVSVFCLIVFLIFSFTFLRKDITLENLRYLLKFISFTNTETSISAAKINYASGEPNRLELFIGDLCTLSPEGYALYDSRGNQIMSEDISYSSPVLKISGKYALCFDIDGSNYSVFNTFTKLYEGQTDYIITDGDIAMDGSFVIASSSREYRTAITLFNDDFTAYSNIYKNDYLMALEMSDDGKYLAVMTSTVNEGEFVTNVELIVPGENSAKHRCSLRGLGYEFYFLNDGYAAVTDEALYFLDENLNPVSVSIHDSQLAMTHSSGKYVVCMYPEGIIGNSYTARIYDMTGKKVFEDVFSGKLTAVDSIDGGDYIFILTGTTLTRINLINKKLSELTVNKDAIDILASGINSVLAAYKNYALTYDLSEIQEHYYIKHEEDAVTETSYDSPSSAQDDTSDQTDGSSRDTNDSASSEIDKAEEAYTDTGMLPIAADESSEEISE